LFQKYDKNKNHAPLKTVFSPSKLQNLTTGLIATISPLLQILGIMNWRVLEVRKS